MRSKAEKRKNDYKHIARKCKILKEVYKDANLVDSLKHQLHRLSKAKVHCSCPICAAKVKTQGYSHSDQKKIAATKYTEEEE